MPIEFSRSVASRLKLLLFLLPIHVSHSFCITRIKNVSKYDGMALHPCKGQCNRGSSDVLGKRSMSMDDNEHDNNDIQKEKENWISGMFTRWKTNDIFVIEEPRLLAGDMVSVLLTCQLLGLVDVLNTPEFWLSGGFAQPVGLMPEGVSTLGTLVKRGWFDEYCMVVIIYKKQGIYNFNCD
mmetsp:Transcript_16971/g.19618  ORF Transcript_16971/g.19618 Transcript_16971/m.19618 type:complete len:181 (-) Transcript_16971:374-916(-)